MSSARITALVVLSIVMAMLLGFNNCSGVKFNTSPAYIKQQQLAQSSSSSLTINGGAPYTNQKLVNLDLYSPRAVSMKISNQSDCSDGTWENFADSKSWTLSKTDANVSVYAQYKDFLDNISPCVSAAIIHDDIAPTAAFNQAAGLITNNPNLMVSWTAQDNLSGVDQIQCASGNGAPTACTSQLTVSGAKDGGNSVQVIVTDKAGNVSRPFTYNWLVDTTPPVVSINTRPPAITGSGSASVEFSATDSGSGVDHLMCQIDGAAAAVCSSPMNQSGFSQGSHTFAVYAIDKAGNSSSAISVTWTVDMAAPSIQFTQTPAAVVNSGTAVFGFTGSKNGQPITVFNCHTDAGAFAPCTSPTTVNGLKEGTHKFEFTGTDSLGNVSAPLAFTWIVDLTPPVVNITSGPGALTNSGNAALTWTATDGLSGVKLVECRIDGAAFQACTLGAISYSSLGEGKHTFDVRATDNGGNIATASRSWVVDLTAPVVKITSGPDAYTKNLTAQLTFTATDNGTIAGFQCKVDNGAYAACSSPYTASNLSEGSHVFYVTATDGAGNVSPAATYSWNLDLSPPIIRVISSPVNVTTGAHAVIQYQVVDLASGVASVMCGLTSPSGSVASCQAAATVDLGTLAAGNYVFTITATDNVGNSMTDTVAFTVSMQAIICDPFKVGGDTTCSGGMIGDIFYLDSGLQSQFQALSNKTVDFFLNSGIKVNALLNLNQLFVSTRSFSTGFPTQSGDLVKDNQGNPLYSYFAFHLRTIFKLDPVNDQPGWYQFATLSDDGSVVNITPSAGAASQNLISSDGDHSTRMGCSSQAIYVDDTSRIGMEIKYYQGPPTEIALVLMWNKVSGPTAALDASCGLSGNGAFFGPSPYTNFTTSGYGALVNRGWRVVAPSNFVAPPQ